MFNIVFRNGLDQHSRSKHWFQMQASSSISIFKELENYQSSRNLTVLLKCILPPLLAAVL